MARTGLRMMPTFPPPPLSFRTVGFPQYGWKAGLSGGACPVGTSVKPAPGIPVMTSGLPPPFVFAVAAGNSTLCVVDLRAVEHRRASGCYRSTPGALARVRVILSRSVITYSAPSAPRAGTSRFRHPLAYTRRLRCAGAPRRPARGSVLSLHVPSRHAAFYDPGEPADCICPVLRRRHWPSPPDDGLGALDSPTIRFWWGQFSGLPVRICYGLSSCSPPCADPTGGSTTTGRRRLLHPSFRRFDRSPRRRVWLRWQLG